MMLMMMLNVSFPLLRLHDNALTRMPLTALAEIPSLARSLWLCSHWRYCLQQKDVSAPSSTHHSGTPALSFSFTNSLCPLPPSQNYTYSKCYFFFPIPLCSTFLMRTSHSVSDIFSRWHNYLFSCPQKRQSYDEEVRGYSVTWPCQPVQGKPHLGKGSPQAPEEGYQKETQSSQKSQEHGQTQLSEGGWYFSSGQSCGYLFSTLSLSECVC